MNDPNARMCERVNATHRRRSAHRRASFRARRAWRKEQFLEKIAFSAPLRLRVKS